MNKLHIIEDLIFDTKADKDKGLKFHAGKPRASLSNETKMQAFTGDDKSNNNKNVQSRKAEMLRDLKGSTLFIFNCS